MASDRQIEQAFIKGARDITDAVVLARLREAIRRGDIAAVLETVDIEDEAFDALRVALVQTYAEGGVNEITGMSFRPAPRWNSASPEAERYARDVVGRHITLISEDSRQAVRHVVADGYAFGRGTDRIARDIVGRVGRNGQRTGGIVGLNAQQAQWVYGWTDELGRRHPGFREKLQQGLPVESRLLTAADRRIIARGNLTSAEVDRLTASYNNRMLLSRGRTIARTERGAAINAGRQEAWRQAVDKVGIDPSRIRKTWRHARASMHDRPSHVAANGDTVMGLNTPFDIEGQTMQYPHDPSAPARHTINCGCQVLYSVGNR